MLIWRIFYFSLSNVWFQIKTWLKFGLLCLGEKISALLLKPEVLKYVKIMAFFNSFWSFSILTNQKTLSQNNKSAWTWEIFLCEKVGSWPKIWYKSIKMSDQPDHNVSPSNADNSISSNLPPPPPSNATVNQLSGMSV